MKENVLKYSCTTRQRRHSYQAAHSSSYQELTQHADVRNRKSLYPITGEIVAGRRPEHGFLQLLERHVVGIANCLQFLVQVIEGLYRSLVWDLAKRPRHFRQDRPAPL